MRTIKIKLTTQANPVSIETSASYLNEFKAEPKVQELNINWSNSKLIDMASKTTMELDNTVLPAGDAYFFVFPTKTSSGVDYSKHSYSELRKICATKLRPGTISANPTKLAMITELNKLSNKSQPVKSVTPTESIPVTKQAVNSGVIVYETITSETLTQEYKDIAKKLK